MTKSILIFGVGPLQKSLIERCKKKGLYTIGIDPDAHAAYKDFVDAFEVVSGQDYDSTLAVTKKYKVAGIITAATDKPLIMMARLAEELNLPFFSVETAEYSTDKFLMKQKFQQAGIPCAKGFLINNTDKLNHIPINYPVIAKPRDNSGSRGVIYCKNEGGLKKNISESLRFTQKGNVLIEEYIEGKEYSVEGIHYKGESHVIQITEKITTKFPYNVELGHLQPADVTDEEKKEIERLLRRIAETLRFENCASHTELKISSNGIKIIETSPRLGGDFISSTLVPLSTGVNMEDTLIDISTGSPLAPGCCIPFFHKNSGIIYFELPEGFITSVSGLDELNREKGIQKWEFDLKVGDRVNKITSSLNRYGYAIFQSTNSSNLHIQINEIIKNKIVIEKC